MHTSQISFLPGSAKLDRLFHLLAEQEQFIAAASSIIDEAVAHCEEQDLPLPPALQKLDEALDIFAFAAQNQKASALLVEIATEGAE